MVRKLVISTTLDIELHNEAKKFGIKWSEALAFGINQMLTISYEGEGVVSEETAMCKLIKLRKANAVMQEMIQDLNKQIEAKQDAKP